MMTRWTRWIVVAAAALGVVATQAEGKEKGVYQAERAGWLLGMYLGEEKGQPHPFVLKVEEKTEAAAKGVRPGDELIRFQDQEVRELKPLLGRVGDMRAGREVVLWMRRGSQHMQYRLRVPKPEKPSDEKAKDEKKDDAEAKKDGDKNADGESKKKSKKKKPIVVKPIPGPEDPGSP